MNEILIYLMAVVMLLSGTANLMGPHAVEVTAAMDPEAAEESLEQSDRLFFDILTVLGIEGGYDEKGMAFVLKAGEDRLADLYGTAGTDSFLISSDLFDGIALSLEYMSAEEPAALPFLSFSPDRVTEDVAGILDRYAAAFADTAESWEEGDFTAEGVYAFSRRAVIPMSGSEPERLYYRMMKDVYSLEYVPVERFSAMTRENIHDWLDTQIERNISSAGTDPDDRMTACVYLNEDGDIYVTVDQLYPNEGVQLEYSQGTMPWSNTYSVSQHLGFGTADGQYRIHDAVDWQTDRYDPSAGSVESSIITEYSFVSFVPGSAFALSVANCKLPSGSLFIEAALNGDEGTFRMEYGTEAVTLALTGMVKNRAAETQFTLSGPDGRPMLFISGSVTPMDEFLSDFSFDGCRAVPIGAVLPDSEDYDPEIYAALMKAVESKVPDILEKLIGNLPDESAQVLLTVYGGMMGEGE